MINFISRNIDGIVKGNRRRVHQSIKAMNRRVELSNRKSPWHSNSWDFGPTSEAFINHMIEKCGWVESFDDYEDYQ